MAKNYDKGKVIGMGKGPTRDNPGLKIKASDMKDIACENCATLMMNEGKCPICTAAINGLFRIYE